MEKVSSCFLRSLKSRSFINHHVVSSRCLSSSVKSSESTPSNNGEIDANGEKLLYLSPQHLTIRLMLAGVTTNTMIWAYLLANAYYNPGEAVGLTAALGQPLIGGAGLIGSGFLLALARAYASKNVKRAYETADGKRVGFQMHNMTGNYGRKVEASVLNIKGTRLATKSLTGKPMGRLVLAEKETVLIDLSGQFHGDRLKNIIDNVAFQEEFHKKDKETRVEALKGKTFNTHHHNRKKR